MSTEARQSGRWPGAWVARILLRTMVGAAIGAAVGAGAGCAPASNKAAIPQVRVAAETDLDCGPDDIRIEEELGGRFLAIGCGRKARYDARCDGVRCVVTPADGPALGWRDRPDPGP